ncbi:cytochrome c oxidase accessory protein CcoG [Pedobacter sp. SYP-B3415]|uniref:cytochrome c oxidase accessory protein CcoG n=1 Tax=Pedobacter sp. SYP-B3415 TaxID=2496641 RepID=UPI00101BC5B4|nr:cytochrome c oxidase accessory protein CcoG [Pedobacter sp. SYP-B3415]
MQILSRQFIYPKRASGPLFRRRGIVAAFLLGLLAVSPFLRFKGEQLVLLNVLERKFVFFGLIFTPQDFYLAAFAMLLFILFVVLFTLRFGRLWCGWACPQTIFMEMVFRRIEYWIEGDAAAQKKLDSQSWNRVKFSKKAAKHVLFFAVSFLIANIFLAYVIGSDQLLKILSEPMHVHISGFAAVVLFTSVFYFVFSYLRETVCTVICPYGRLQNVLLDKDSLVVAYNSARGEPRAKHQKSLPDMPAGDCVDCSLCVQVCPTGIDIRKGTQLECINCTACIDVCNTVMLKTKKAPDLIGFYNARFLETGKAKPQLLKQYGYATVVVAGLILFGSMLYQRQPVDATILRASGTLYQVRPDGSVSNLYTATLINKTNRKIPIRLLVAAGYRIQYIQKKELLIDKEATTNFSFFLIRDKKWASTSYKTDVSFSIHTNGRLVGTASTKFFSPIE